MTVARWITASILFAAVAGLAGGCSVAAPASPATSPSAASPSPAAVATDAGAPSPSPTTPPSVASAEPSPAVDGPPTALLRVDGGDPVAGQLGTYTWDGGGSDSPWLPGAPIAAATGEILTMTLPPDMMVTDWSAVIAPAANGDETGAIEAGAGSGPVEVTAPAAGTWTLAITVRAGERGAATWFWRLEIP